MVGLALLSLMIASGLALPPTQENTLTSDFQPGKYIIGGDFVKQLGTWKSMCSLQLGHWHFCGASLIDNSTVVTAAHCLLNYPIEQFVIVCGHLNNADHSQGDWELHELKEWYIHKSYEWDFDAGFPNDMAIIKLAHPVNPHNPSIAPVELAEDDGYDWTGAECYAVGWGKVGEHQDSDGRLKYTRLEPISYEDCVYYWGGSALSYHVCAKDTERHDTGACNGDSGGPLYCKRGDKFYQVGVFSWMAGNCDTYWPSMYSSVPHFRAWIKEHSGV